MAVKLLDKVKMQEKQENDDNNVFISDSNPRKHSALNKIPSKDGYKDK